MSNFALERAKALDAADGLAGFRAQFHIPKQPDGRDEIYLCGNSLGLQPKRTADFVGEFLNDWANLGVRGHFEPEHAWLPYHELLTSGLVSLTGAKPTEVVAMNSLTANLHLMMVSFYRPTARRCKVLIEDHSFPSDSYAVHSQILYHGYNPEDAIVTVRPQPGEELLRDEDLLAAIDQHGDTLALILLPGVQYYTGQVLPMAKIVQHGHAVGAAVGFDLAHAIGNIPLRLHEWGPDFACWCSYKYLNSGAGAVGGCFVHERHVANRDLPRFAGWWGHDKASRFKMGPDFQPIPTAEGWQLSNPPILTLAAIRASLSVFQEAGGMEPLRRKSECLTGYLQELLHAECGKPVTIITPSEPERRGCQLSLCITSSQFPPREVHKRLEASGVACDWREPNVIRVAPVPLYNSFADVWHFVQLLRGLL